MRHSSWCYLSNIRVAYSVWFGMGDVGHGKFDRVVPAVYTPLGVHLGLPCLGLTIFGNLVASFW